MPVLYKYRFPLPVPCDPATDVSKDNIPDNTDVEMTILQSTSLSNTVVPIVAAAVYAIVFTALIPATFIHFFTFLFIIFLISARLMSDSAKTAQVNKWSSNILSHKPDKILLLPLCSTTVPYRIRSKYLTHPFGSIEPLHNIIVRL